MKTSERIKELMTGRGLTAYHLSKETGVSQATISRILNKESKPNINTLKTLAKYFNLEDTWLLTGEGPMLRAGGGNVSVGGVGANNGNVIGGVVGSVGVNNGISQVVGGSNLRVSNGGGNASVGSGGTGVGVPYYDVDFAGGWASAELFSEARPSFYIASPDFGGAELACNLVGHSVSRRIPHGAIIGIREVRDWQSYFPTNELYALIMGNGLRTVKVVKRGADRGSLLLLPDPLEAHDRTGYETEEVEASFVSRMFQVVAWARFERLAM